MQITVDVNTTEKKLNSFRNRCVRNDFPSCLMGKSGRHHRTKHLRKKLLFKGQFFRGLISPKKFLIVQSLLYISRTMNV